MTLASADAEARARALAEAERALQIARQIPFGVLVVHLGLPRTQEPAPASNSRDAARRSIEALQRRPSRSGCGSRSRSSRTSCRAPASLVHFVEDVSTTADVGICLDFGHAHIDGDLVDAIETVSEHLVATHVHDNRGRTDDHLVPFDGTIDWPAALTALQKVGYDGALMLELAAHGRQRTRWRRAREARQRMERMLEGRGQTARAA